MKILDTRTKQIEQGLQAAKEQGLGEWTVKQAGLPCIHKSARLRF